MRNFLNALFVLGLASAVIGLTLCAFGQWPGLLILTGGVLIFTAGLLLRNSLIEKGRF